MSTAMEMPRWRSVSRLVASRNPGMWSVVFLGAGLSATSTPSDSSSELLGPAGVLWSQVLDAVPETARRDRGVYLARHATAAAVAGEPDQAVEIARTAATIAVETRPVRMRRELATLERNAAAARCPDRPGPR